MPVPDVKDFCHSPSTSPEGDRFTGYNLPTVNLDAGFPYYVVDVHPYFFNQPMVWQEPAFSVGFNTAGGHITPIFSPDSPNDAPVGEQPFILPI